MATREAVAETGARSLVLDVREVAARPWAPFGESDGVRYRTLWIEPHSRSYAGVLKMDPGTEIAGHAHRYAVHHVWVTEGECTIEGRRLGAGSYVFVPAGTDHGIEGAGPEGCTLFYLYLRRPSGETQNLL